MVCALSPVFITVTCCEVAPSEFTDHSLSLSMNPGCLSSIASSAAATSIRPEVWSNPGYPRFAAVLRMRLSHQAGTGRVADIFALYADIKSAVHPAATG